MGPNRAHECYTEEVAWECVEIDFGSGRGGRGRLFVQTEKSLEKKFRSGLLNQDMLVTDADMFLKRYGMKFEEYMVIYAAP